MSYEDDLYLALLSKTFHDDSYYRCRDFWHQVCLRPRPKQKPTKPTHVRPALKGGRYIF